MRYTECLVHLMPLVNFKKKSQKTKQNHLQLRTFCITKNGTTPIISQDLNGKMQKN